MSDDVKHAEDELGLDSPVTQGNDVSTDGAEATSSPTEDEPASLDLEDEDKAAKREQAKQAQIKALGAKILTGELSYENFPEAQRWLIPDVAQWVGGAKAPSQEATPKAKAPEMDVKAEVKFELYRDQLKKAGLDKETAAKLSKAFKQFRRVDNKLDALKSAAELVGVDLDNIQPPQTKTIPSVRVGSGAKHSEIGFDNVDDPNVITTAELMELTKGGR